MTQKKKAGEATKEAGKDTGEAAKDAAKATAKGTKSVAKKTARGTKKAASTVKRKVTPSNTRATCKDGSVQSGKTKTTACADHGGVSG